MHEIETLWSLEDIALANAALDLRAEYEQAAADEARRASKRGR